jgi:hypothetical protein
MENIEALPPMSLEDFSTPLEMASDAIPVLYQAGYLTIKSYDREYNNYVLGVPNTEVQVALRQLEELNYALPFTMDGRELVKLGVNFSTEKRTIDAWEKGN